MNPEDNDVLAQFGKDLTDEDREFLMQFAENVRIKLAHFKVDLDELCRCGGAEAQSLIRPRLHAAYHAMTPTMQEALRAQYSNHCAIEGKWVEFWEVPKDNNSRPGSRAVPAFR